MRVNLTHIFYVENTNLLIALEEDDRQFRISREFIYHLYVIDCKKYCVKFRKMSYFRG